MAVWLAIRPLPMSLLAPLVFLGRILYPLYLLHQEMGFPVIARLEAVGVTPDAAALLTAALAIVAAWGISRTVEYPAQAWPRARYRRWRERAARASRLRTGVWTLEVIPGPE